MAEASDEQMVHMLKELNTLSSDGGVLSSYLFGSLLRRQKETKVQLECRDSVDDLLSLKGTITVSMVKSTKRDFVLPVEVWWEDPKATIKMGILEQRHCSEGAGMHGIQTMCCLI